MTTTKNINVIKLSVTNDKGKTINAFGFIGKDASNEWKHVIFAKDKQDLMILEYHCDPAVQMQFKRFAQLVEPQTLPKEAFIAKVYHFPPQNVVYRGDLPELMNIPAVSLDGFICDPTEQDKNGISMKDYILSIAATHKVQNATTNTIVTRKLAFKKRVINWEKTWQSDKLTPEEKEYLTVPLDLNIYAANQTRQSYKIMEHILETEYPDHPWTAIGLHGDPASGKTTAIATYAAAHHAPILYIACSSVLKIQKLLAKITPQQLAQNKEAQLTVEETIWLKCFYNNLPLIVNLDEFNLLDIQETNALAPIITEHKVMVDALDKGFKNDNTIIYVASWNPNTSCSRSLDEKMYDRFFFINFEAIDPAVQKSFKQDLTVGALLGITTQAQDNIIKGLPQEDQDFIKKNCAPNASVAALTAFVQERSTPKSTPEPKKRVFVAHNVEDIVLDDEQSIREAVGKIEEFRVKVSDTLFNQTRGCDTKNPDRNFGFYIPYRSGNYFADLIFQYSDVEAATKRFIQDLLPGGHVLRIAGKGGNNLKEDNVPETVATDIVSTLGKDVQTLNNVLFSQGQQYSVQQNIYQSGYSYSQDFLDGCDTGDDDLSKTKFQDGDIDSLLHEFNQG